MDSLTRTDDNMADFMRKMNLGLFPSMLKNGDWSDLNNSYSIDESFYSKCYCKEKLKKLIFRVTAITTKKKPREMVVPVFNFPITVPTYKENLNLVFHLRTSKSVWRILCHRERLCKNKTLDIWSADLFFRFIRVGRS